MLSNIIKYMQYTSMKRKCDTTTNVKHAESIERVEKREKIRSTAALPNSN